MKPQIAAKRFHIEVVQYSQYVLLNYHYHYHCSLLFLCVIWNLEVWGALLINE